MTCMYSTYIWGSFSSMNVFCLDADPKKCAEYHCDKHVIKMILETAQLLCSVHHVTSNNGAPYKLTHKNHPCAIWARESLSNYVYLCQLGLELCKEYTYRYGKTHKTEAVIRWCMDHIPPIKDKGFTHPAKAMPEEYQMGDVVSSYRAYYKGEKVSIARWTKRNSPQWFITGEKL